MKVTKSISSVAFAGLVVISGCSIPTAEKDINSRGDRYKIETPYESLKRERAERDQQGQSGRTYPFARVRP